MTARSVFYNFYKRGMATRGLLLRLVRSVRGDDPCYYNGSSDRAAWGGSADLGGGMSSLAAARSCPPSPDGIQPQLFFEAFWPHDGVYACLTRSPATSVGLDRGLTSGQRGPMQICAACSIASRCSRRSGTAHPSPSIAA